MLMQNYRLDDVVSKTTEDLKLWQAERGLVKIGKGTLTVAIRMGAKQEGCMFHGRGRLVLDTIVETREGAVGKPVEKEVNRPFLMLGKTDEIERHLSTANNEDLGKVGYQSEKELLTKAEDLFDRFFKKGTAYGCQRFGERNGSVFAFLNDANKLDLLVVNDSKLVYKAMNTVFVSNKDRVVLKSPEHIVVSTNGKSIIVKKRRMSIPMP